VSYQEIIPLLREAEEEKYYGSIELKYERGQIVIVKRSETLKPADFQRDSREVNRDQRTH
jgi:hypothetical protein